MSEQSWPYAGDAVTEAEWSAMARLFREVGVVVDVGGQLSVSAVGGQVQVTVAAGEAFIEGFYYRNDDTATLDLDAADLNQGRIDLVVVRSDRGEGQARLAVKTGTPAAEPEAPAVVQDHDGQGVFELALAEVSVPAASPEADEVLDVRRFSQVVGGVQFVTTAERDALDQLYVGRPVFNTDVNLLEVWDGSQWRRVDQPDIDTAPLRQEYIGLFAETNLRLWQLEADVIGEVEGFVGWHGEAFLDGQDEVAAETGDISVSRGARLGDGGASLATLPEIGEAFGGGFFAGIIDTDANSADIDANDTRQNGKRYALIVSPQAIGEPSTSLRWRSSRTGVSEAAARTRWDGLYVTNYIINFETLADFPIFEFCDQVRSSDPVPDDGGSDWYIPALDELELLYRNLKPGPEDNDVRERDLEFPDLFQQGENPSSDPQGTAYTESDPQQTTVADFQGSGGAETLQFEGDSDNNRLWSATESATDRAWAQSFRGSSAGLQSSRNKDVAGYRCRLVRRVLL